MCFYCYICVSYQYRRKMCYEYFHKLLSEYLSKSRLEFLNLNLVSLGTLNLQRFSMIKIAVGIWSQKKWNDVVSQIIFECRKKNDILDWQCKWTAVTERAFEDVRSLNLPAILTDQLEFIVEMVGHELLFFLKYYKNYSYSHCYKDCIPVEEIAWTSFGTIDKYKTHHNFTYRCAIVHVKFACPLCIDDTIIRLWVRIMRNKKLTHATRSYFSYFNLAEPFQLVIFWGNVFKNAICRLQLLCDPFNLLRQVSTINEKMALVSAQEGNIEVFTYYWQRMDDQERNSTLPVLMQLFNEERIRAERYSSFSEILLFILNDASESTKEEVIRQCGFILVNGLLEKWPYYGIIVNQFDRIIPYLSTEDYKRILPEILLKMHSIEVTRIKHKYYRNEFRFLWGNMEYYMARTSNEFIEFLHQRFYNNV